MKDHLWFDAIGWVGAAALLVAYAMVSAQKMGRTFFCVSVPERRRQPPPGRKHNFLWVVSLHLCEPRLGSHCHFHNRHKEAGFVSLV